MDPLMSDDVPASAPFRHTYHLNPLRLAVMPVLWGALTGLFLVLWLLEPSSSPDRSLYLTLAGILSAILLPFVAVGWQSRLVLTHEGIAHHQLGYTVRSSWQNLTHLSLEPRAEGLYLAESGTRSKLLRAAASAAAPTLASARSVVGDVHALREGRFIFLAPFMSHWKRGPLRDDVMRCAPHLFTARP
jgi:hypothetical protein